MERHTIELFRLPSESEQVDASSLLNQVVGREPAREIKFAGVVIGILADLSPTGTALVDFPGNPISRPLAARTTVALRRVDIGREVALMFELGDPNRPVLTGLVQVPQCGGDESSLHVIREADNVRLVGSRIVIEVSEELILKTPRAKIAIRENGDVEILGMRIVSRARSLVKLLAPLVRLN